MKSVISFILDLLNYIASNPFLTAVCSVEHYNQSHKFLSEAFSERLVEHCTFQNRNPVRVFIYHCISEGNRLSSENFGCHFHFILHIMSDKAAFVSTALCIAVTGETSISTTPTGRE